MKTPQQRFRDIMNDVNFIVPAPDFAIVHEYNNDVYIECPERRADHEVIDYVQKQRGGHWLLAIWVNTENGVTIFKDNPHQNKRGLWVWILRKA